MAERKSESALTDFKCLLLSPDMTRDRLQKMDTAKTAKHYGLPEEWVRFDRDWQLAMKGGK